MRRPFYLWCAIVTLCLGTAGVAAGVTADDTLTVVLSGIAVGFAAAGVVTRVDRGAP